MSSQYLPAAGDVSVSNQKQPEIGLPSGWTRCSISDIAEVNPKKINAEPEELAGFVPMANAPDTYFGQLIIEKKFWGDIKKSYTNFRDGDVIVAKVTPCFENGKASIVDKLPNGIGAGSSEFFVLRPRITSLSKRYLFSVIKSQKFLSDGASNMTGAVGLRRVPRAFVEKFELSLPPLAEQKVIADKLDTLLAQVETTKARLQRIPDILKRFRQSVLSAAVSGKLTEEWRCTPVLVDWKDSKVAHIVEKIEAGKNLKCIEAPPQKSEYGIIKISAVTWGIYDEEQSKTLPDETQFLETRRINVGDFLISRANTIELLGNPVIVHEVTKNLMLSDKVLRLVMKEKEKPWISIFLRSRRGRMEIESRSTGNQMSMRNIGQKALLDIDIPRPPEKEQAEIVRRVEELFQFADQVEQKANAALERVNNLTQSILAKAFRGDLTADWRAENPDLISGDNSAEALLEKIKAEREAMAPKKKTRKKKA
ncbi:restriction endonuclease subunit S [Saccharospirillum salsuginis]|uniref:Type-1 restriction enzyme EcoKI specificity protein n=1 Tax=Saccharospirillum salsuginis TaxID=418750 RepID=A0A918N755_9GAMM|nr:restriction endonuclease subunit S [Saccharospirillum salsuginis]GGX46283.1 type-1 restriction enzyme EcoKI specificity protein [Saccharospirillum salsuginis]